MKIRTIQPDSQQLPYGAVTEQQFRLLFSQLKKEPKGILRKDLLNMPGISRGTGSKLIRRIHDAGLIRIVELPKSTKCRGYNWHGPYLLIPTDELLEMPIEEALKKVAKKPGRPKALINMSELCELLEVLEECVYEIDTRYGPPGSNRIDYELIVRARTILAKVREKVTSNE